MVMLPGSGRGEGVDPLLGSPPGSSEHPGTRVPIIRWRAFSLAQAGGGKFRSVLKRARRQGRAPPSPFPKIKIIFSGETHTMNPTTSQRRQRNSRLTTLLGTASLLTIAQAEGAFAAEMVAQAEEVPETVLITGSLIRG